MTKEKIVWVVYKGYSRARVPKYQQYEFKHGYRYDLPESIAVDLISNHSGFSRSKKNIKEDKK